MGLVVDANLLGEICRNNKKAVELLQKTKNHRIIFCTEIMKKYKPFPKREFCRKNATLIEEWIFTIVRESPRGKKGQDR